MYTDLITFSRLQQANTGKVIDDLTADEQEARDVITGVTSMIETRLSREVIVRRHTQRFRPQDWHEDKTVDDSATGEGYLAYADAQPVVQIDAEDSAFSVRGDDRFVAGTREIGAVDYFAGWRRPDQVLTDPAEGECELPTGDGEALEGLTVLPPTLPPIFQEVAVDLTLHTLSQRDRNLGERLTRTVGAQETVVEGADPSFVSSRMARLEKYDRSLVL